MHARVSSAGEETTTKRTAPILALLLALAGAAQASQASNDCLGAWRGAGALGDGNATIACRDGDPSCDRDGAADGTCRVAVSYCLNVPGCTPGTLGPVRIRGKGGASLSTLAASLTYPVATADVCTASAEVAVRRRATLRASVRDTTSRRRDADRLRISCSPTGAAGRALVVTTDFETGVLATVGLRGARRVGEPGTPIHSDAVVRVAGDMVFVLNRFLGDNLQRLDPKTLRTRVQCSTGTASNPHDIAVVAPDKAYVTRYDRTELWIVDPSVTSCGSFRRGTIDLSPYADADGLPEMSQMAVVDGRLFVAIQRLDRERGFRHTGPGRLIVIDVATDAVIGEIVLHGANPFGDSTGIPRDPATGALVVSSVGDIYGVGDGGLERIDPASMASEGRFYVDESAVGGNILDFVLLSPTKGYAVVQAANLDNLVVVFDPTGATPTRPLFSREAYLPDLVLGPDGLLWLADQGLPDPGIRLFDPVTDKPLRRRPLPVGLPPFSIGFLP